MTDSTDIMHRTTDLVDPNSRPSNLDYIVLDASGSMLSKWLESLQAIDNYVAGLTIDTRIIAVSFTTGTGGNAEFIKFRDCRREDWKPLLLDQPQCRGHMTPLYDAINTSGRECRDINPIHNSVVYVTDGEENASKTTQPQAKAILDWMRAKGWQITFIGCDFDNSHQAALLGGNAQSAIGVSKARLVTATKELAKKRNLYSQFGVPMHWSKEDHQQFGGYIGGAK
jgi:hypothetical protein